MPSSKPLPKINALCILTESKTNTKLHRKLYIDFPLPYLYVIFYCSKITTLWECLHNWVLLLFCFYFSSCLFSFPGDLAIYRGPVWKSTLIEYAPFVKCLTNITVSGAFQRTKSLGNQCRRDCPRKILLGYVKKWKSLRLYSRGKYLKGHKINWLHIQIKEALATWAK